MPTLINLDGFAHQSSSGAQAGSGFIGVYDTVSGAPTFDTAVKRLKGHICSLSVSPNATNQAVNRNIVAGNRIIVASLYIRATAAATTADRFFRVSGPTNPPFLQFNTNGTIGAQTGSGTMRNTAASLADGLWHLIDLRADCSGTTFTVDWTVDGVAQTQASNTSQTAADFTSYDVGRAGSGTPGVFTMWFSDVEISATTADYPIGAHHVFPVYPAGDGTHNLAAHITGEDASTTNLYQHVDDWNGSTADTATYLAQTTIDTAAFAEFTLGAISPVDSAVYDVIGYVAGFASTTGTDVADTQVLTAHGGTLIDHIGNAIDYSGSTTVLGYYRTKLARPAGGWTSTVLNAAVIQWGFSSDVIGNPRLSAVMLEYAAPGGAGLPIPPRTQRNVSLRR